MLRITALVALAPLIFHAFPAAAQMPVLTRAEHESVAAVRILNHCPLTHPDATVGDYGAPAGQGASEGATSLVALGAGVIGDVAEGAINVFAQALDEASRQRTFNATGYGSFDFYRVAVGDGTTSSLHLEPVLRPLGGRCLLMAVADPEGSQPSRKDLATFGSTEAAWETDVVAKGMPPAPSLYIEAVLQARPDGFVVRPVLVWYRSPLRSAPRRSLASELHVIFATPAAPTDQSTHGETFAVARIALPPLTPGETGILRHDTLSGFSSPVLPLRPTAGSPAMTMTTFTEAAAALEANKRDQVTRERAVRRLRTALANANDDDQAEPQDALDIALEAQADVIAEEQGLRGRLEALSTAAGVETLGSTNVQMRLVLVRDANAFGQAIATALKGRSAAVGDAVEDRLAQTATWDERDGAYARAMADIDTKQMAVTLALAGDDPGAVIVAREALLSAQIKANDTAAASHREIPFPHLAR